MDARRGAVVKAERPTRGLLSNIFHIGRHQVILVSIWLFFRTDVSAVNAESKAWGFLWVFSPP